VKRLIIAEFMSEVTLYRCGNIVKLPRRDGGMKGGERALFPADHAN
jgi:hypothetical protein